MATVYNWNCKTVDVHPTEAGEKDVVYNVHWIVTGISDELDPEGNAYQATTIGTQTVPLDPESEFIPFEDLTNEIVCLLYTSPSPRDRQKSRMPSSA